MEFLKAILGDELYQQFEIAINAYNGNEANKDKQVNLANLRTGKYVDVDKYNNLQAMLDGKTGELDSANALIADLKKGNKDNEGLQTKITEYEGQIAQLQAELAKTQLENAIQLALRDAKVTDADYLTYKLKEKYPGDELKLGEDGKIKGWDDKLAGLKTQFPNWFESGEGGNGDGYYVVTPNKLKQGENGDVAPTKESFRAMSYEQRAALKQKNEQLYKQLARD